MSAVHPEPQPSSSDPSACPLCATPVAAGAVRCPSCGMRLDGVGGRPGPFSRAILWWWAAALLLIYLAVLVIVTLIPD